jgi:hypothetical protein
MMASYSRGELRMLSDLQQKIKVIHHFRCTCQPTENNYPDAVEKYFWVCTMLLIAGLRQTAAQVSFAPAANYTVGNLPYSVVATNFNGSGKIDLVSANFSDGTLSVLTNGGNGSFGSNATLNVGIGTWSGPKGGFALSSPIAAVL